MLGSAELENWAHDEIAAKKALASQVAKLRREAALKQLRDGNRWLTAHLADHTFEAEFAGNASTIVSLLGDVFKDAVTIATSKTELCASILRGEE